MDALSATALRVIIAVIGVLILAGIYFLGRPRSRRQGRRTAPRHPGNDRVEPVLGDTDVPESPGPDVGEVTSRHAQQSGRAGGEPGSPDPEALSDRDPRSRAGYRGRTTAVDRIVTLYVVAHADGTFDGSDIAVAAEKVGLKFGAMHIFHRLVDSRPDSEPVFSMANMVKPGAFDMQRIVELKTPGITLFVTLPGPLPALDAWEAMLPTARRLAELLDGQLLDEDRNALGRQRIAGMRETLRQWDRQHEGADIASPLQR
jgi:cell division protein ZipA